MSPAPARTALRSAIEELAAEELAAARNAVEEARVCLAHGFLHSAGTFERLLRQAVCSLRNCGGLLPHCGPGEKALMAEPARILKQDLVRLAALAEHTMSFCNGWMALWGGIQSGYTVSGTAATPRLASRLDLEA
jgi:hypothetical protein